MKNLPLARHALHVNFPWPVPQGKQRRAHLYPVDKQPTIQMPQHSPDA